MADFGLELLYHLEGVVEYFRAGLGIYSYAPGIILILAFLIFLFGFKFFRGFTVIKNSMMMALGGFFIASLFDDPQLFLIVTLGLFIAGLIIFGLIFGKRYRYGQLFMIIYSLIFAILYLSRFILFSYIFLIYLVLALLSILSFKLGQVLFIIYWQFTGFFIGFLFLLANGIVSFGLAVILTILGLIVQFIFYRKRVF